MTASANQIDVAGQQIGGVYAQALVDAAEAAGQTDAMLDEFDALLGEVLDAFPAFDEVLSSEMIAPEEKLQMIDRVFASRISPLLLNFLKVVAEHGRLMYLRAMLREVHERVNELRARVRVELTSATPLDAELTEQLTGQIRQMLGREPLVVTTVDPELIGGILLRVGDTVYDGSVAAQLGRLKNELRQQSTAEIESGRIGA